MTETQKNYIRSLAQTNKETKRYFKGDVLVGLYETERAKQYLKDRGFAIINTENVERPLKMCVRIHFEIGKRAYKRG